MTVVEWEILIIWHFNYFLLKFAYEVFFEALEVGVCDDLSVQVSGEDVFDFPGCNELLRGHSWKFLPFFHFFYSIKLYNRWKRSRWFCLRRKRSHRLPLIRHWQGFPLLPFKSWRWQHRRYSSLFFIPKSCPTIWLRWPKFI